MGVADDVENVLSGLEQRLVELQAELEGEGVAAGAPRRPVAASPAVAPGDALDRFGESLRRAATDLVSAYDRALAETRGLDPGEALLFRDEVALEVDVTLEGLCALSVALRRIEGVAAVSLRAYAGGHAALDLSLDRGVPLVPELRRALGTPVAVVEARHGRLALDLR